jgi:hypothetical protein
VLRLVCIISVLLACRLILTIKSLYNCLRALCRAVDGQSLFDFTVQDANGADVKLESLRGSKAYVVVNVATK